MRNVRERQKSRTLHRGLVYATSRMAFDFIEMETTIGRPVLEGT